MKGIIAIKLNDKADAAAMVEITCNSASVERDPRFKAFANKLAEVALEHKISAISDLEQANFDDNVTVTQARDNLIADNIGADKYSSIKRSFALSRVFYADKEEFNCDRLGIYVHRGYIGVIVGIQGGDAELAKDMAMQIAAYSPKITSIDNVPDNILAKEINDFISEYKTSGKPLSVMDKVMAREVSERLQKFEPLLDQAFIKDTSKTVVSILGKKKAKVVNFIRYELGCDSETVVDDVNENFDAAKIEKIKQQIIKLRDQASNSNPQENKIIKTIEENILTRGMLLQYIEDGENINANNEAEDSPLTLICRSEDLEFARILLEAGADVDNKGDDDDCDSPRPLTVATALANTELVKLLLEFGADIYQANEDHETALMLAYRVHDIKMLLLLLKYKAEDDARHREDIKANPEQHDEGYKNMVLAEEKWLGQDAPADVCAIIKKLVLADADLQQYSELLPLLDSINVVDVASDLCGGNADDKIEVAIVELGAEVTQHLEYFYMSNWSYGEAHLVLNWKNKNINVFTATEDSFDFSAANIKSICDLAVALGLGDLTLKAFAKFMIYLLSRMVQKEYLLDGLESHGIYIRLDPDQLIEPNELLAKHFATTPIKDLAL